MRVAAPSLRSGLEEGTCPVDMFVPWQVSLRYILNLTCCHILGQLLSTLLLNDGGLFIWQFFLNEHCVIAH